MRKKMNYDEAYEQLNKIFNRIENENIGLEELSKDIKKAQELITFCKTRLREIEENITGITQDGDSE